VLWQELQICNFIKETHKAIEACKYMKKKGWLMDINFKALPDCVVVLKDDL
jgi:hypothetical protein